MGTNSPQAKNLCIRVCSPSQASSEGVFFPVWKSSGISEDNDDWFNLVCSSRSSLVPHLGLILSSHSFWSLSIGEGVMGLSVVTRSCRALGAEKLPITRVVPSLVSIYLPNKGVGHSGTTRNWWENICPSKQQRSAQVNLSVIVFSVAPKMVQVCGEKALE